MFTLANEQESDVLCSFDLKPEFKIEPLSSSLNASGPESLTLSFKRSNTNDL